MNKRLKILLISLAILVVVFLFGNIGLNFWLQNKLPNYIKNNSHYKVSYSELYVDIATGNISATKIDVKNKNPAYKNVIGLDGTIDSLKISRLGIYDALFNKKINSSDLLMVNPNLKVTLAKPIDDRTGKERNPFLFKNLNIKNGNITIYRHTEQKFLAVNELQLNVTNLQMTEKSVEKKLPVVFDKYDINGKNFYFRPDNVYALKADFITTKNGLMNIRNFSLNPLLTIEQFRRFYPKKQNLFTFRADEMNFKDIVMKKNKISLSNVDFQNPNVKMFTTGVKSSEKQKPFTYEVNLEDVKMNKAKVEILKPDKTQLFAAGSLNLNISKLKMDEETAKGNIPFAYEKFLIGGENIQYFTKDQNIHLRSIAINPKSLESRNVSVKPLVSTSNKPLFDLSLGHIYATVNHWKLEKGKLNMEVNNLVLDDLNGTFTAPENEQRKQLSLRSLDLPLKVKNITLKNSNITVDRPDKPLVFKNLYANVQNLEMNSETVKNSIPLKVGSYTFTTKNFSYRTKFYTLTAGLFKFQKNNFMMNDFAMKPNFSRSQFVRLLSTEKDLYDISVKQVTGNGNWDLMSAQKHINISNIVLNGANANIFRSKIPKDDATVKPMYSALLRSIKFPVYVGNLDIKNSVLVYEEDTKKSEGPGKLTFGNFNMNVKNLNSAKMKGKPTQVPITIQTSFMNASPMNVKWNFDTANPSDAFAISGSVSDLPASRINPFIEPYLKVRAKGNIQNLAFSFRGNNSTLNGSLNMKHTDLRVEILKKETGEKNKLLSAIVNLVVKSNSGRYPESVTVDHVKRDVTKSFFNFFWQGIQEGLKKTLIGKNVEKNEKAVKMTVEETKKDLNTLKNTIKPKENAPATAEKKEKKGFLRGLFRKKEKAEN